MTFNRKQFEIEKKQHAEAQAKDVELKNVALDFLTKADRHNYEYQWTWMGMPIIQMPEDIMLIQQLIYETKPDYIVETGIAWGGSVVYYASLCELMGHGEVIAVDTVLPQSNIDKIMAYPFSKRIHLFQGSSVDKEVFGKVKALIQEDSKVMVILDSNHTHEHVYNELNLYAPLIKSGQYILAQDTTIEFVPEQTHRPRPWGHGNNPWTAVQKFLSENPDFTNNNRYNQLSLLTCHKDGWICKK